MNATQAHLHSSTDLGYVVSAQVDIIRKREKNTSEVVM